MNTSVYIGLSESSFMDQDHEKKTFAGVRVTVNIFIKHTCVPLGE